MEYIIAWFAVELISGISTFTFIFLLLYMGERKKDEHFLTIK